MLRCTYVSHSQCQWVEKLPHVKAAFDDIPCKKRHSTCFQLTREALKSDIQTWITTRPESQIYVLSGLAGIGKSTVAFTVADKAKKDGNLAASFFFSRDEAELNNAERFITTVAYQLCVYDNDFAQAI